MWEAKRKFCSGMTVKSSKAVNHAPSETQARMTFLVLDINAIFEDGMKVIPGKHTHHLRTILLLQFHYRKGLLRNILYRNLIRRLYGPTVDDLFIMYFRSSYTYSLTYSQGYPRCRDRPFIYYYMVTAPICSLHQTVHEWCLIDFNKPREAIFTEESTQNKLMCLGDSQYVGDCFF